MSSPEKNTRPKQRQFEVFHSGERIFFHACRPEVVPFVRNVVVAIYGFLIDCSGTRDELVRSGLVEASMFDGLAKPRQRSFEDDYGNTYKVSARARGRFDVQIRTYDSDDRNLNSDSVRKSKWFREHGAAVDLAVAGILKRFTQRAPDTRDAPHA